MLGFTKIAILAASLASVSFAQTTTDCDPLKKSCPNDPALGDGTLATDFRNQKSMPSGWTQANAGKISFDGAGANIIMEKQGDSPILQTTTYFLFGSFEAKVKAGPGTGIVSSIVLLSDTRDEIDWEFTGTNTAQVQSNYFGKGDDSTFDRAAWHAVATPQNTFHTYKVVWTPEFVTWYIDNAVVRTLKYGDAQGGARFPQTPMRVKLGIWAGGDPSLPQGTIDWAGGKTDFSKAPFSMQVESVKIINYTPAKSYGFKDNSGSYQSINVEGGTLLSNIDGSAGAAASSASLTGTTSLSRATAVPTNNPLQSNSTRNATTTSGSTPSASATTSGSRASGTSNAAISSLNSVSMTGYSSVAFGAVAFFMALFV